MWKKRLRSATLRSDGVRNMPQYSGCAARSVRSGPHRPRSKNFGSRLAGSSGLRGTASATKPKSVKIGGRLVDALRVLGWQLAQLPFFMSLNSAMPRASAGLNVALSSSHASNLLSNGWKSAVVCS